MIKATFKTNNNISKFIFFTYIDRYFGRPPIFLNHNYQHPIGEILNWTMRGDSDDIELEIEIHDNKLRKPLVNTSLVNKDELKVKEYYMIDDRDRAKLLGLSIVVGDDSQ